MYTLQDGIGVYIAKSVTRGQCDVRPTITFPAKEHCHWLVLMVDHTMVVCHPAESRRLSWPEWQVVY